MKLTDRANSKLWDALLTEALTEHCERELERLDGTESVGFSPEFDKKIKKLRRSVGIKEQAAGFGKAARSIALTLAVVLSLCFCALLTQQEVYAAVQNVIRETFSDHDLLTFRNKEQTEFDDSKRLGYIPERYELTQINFAGNCITMQYLNAHSDSDLFVFSYSSAGSSFFDMDNERHEYVEETINGQLYCFYIATQDGEDNTAIWYNDSYVYCISGQLSKEEIVEIAENIK